MDFFTTRASRQLLDSDIPGIRKALEGIAAELKRANDLKEQELNKNQENK